MASLGENRSGHGKISVSREFDAFELCGKVNFGQFPREFNEFVEKTAWDPDGNCCHGPNSGFAQYDLIKIYDSELVLQGLPGNHPTNNE